jgi:hypothetical protein
MSAIGVESQYRSGQINGWNRFVEQGSNVFSTFGDLRGAAWGVGCELGRTITSVPAYQNWRDNVWYPGRQKYLGY